jgi:hypothetical protein
MYITIPIRYTAKHWAARHWSRDRRNYSTVITTIARSAIVMKVAVKIYVLALNTVSIVTGVPGTVIPNTGSGHGC